MPVSSEDFRTGMRRLAAAVNVVTTASGTTRRGMTATAVMSLTADPPKIGVTINRSAGSFDLIRGSGRFAVNVLDGHQAAIGAAFAGTDGVTGEARFASGTWTRGATGSPLLLDAAAVFDCIVIQEVDLGTHALFVGLVEEVRTTEKARSLLYLDGEWRRLDRRRAVRPAADVWNAAIACG